MLKFYLYTPAADTCLCEAILKIWYYYSVRIIKIAFACSQIQYKIMTISLYLFSEHISFFLISKVLIVSFISKQMCVLCCLLLLGSEETESNLVCLCDSGAKIIPLGNGRGGKGCVLPL